MCRSRVSLSLSLCVCVYVLTPVVDVAATQCCLRCSGAAPRELPEGCALELLIISQPFATEGAQCVS